MDTALTVRHAGTGSQAGQARPAAAPFAVATDLASSKAVTAAANTTKTSTDTGNSPHHDPSYTGEIILDAQSREVIYRTADPRTRRVLRHVPEVAARRLKAYTRSASAGENPSDVHADIEV